MPVNTIPPVGQFYTKGGGTKFILPASALRFTAKRRLRLSDAEKAKRRERLQAHTVLVTVAD